jgi:hypothetical protein
MVCREKTAEVRKVRSYEERRGGEAGWGEKKEK